ncbi:amino acid ABC transporter ATP-binding protein, partial [Kitasatospora sp. NPDC057015]
MSTSIVKDQAPGAAPLVVLDGVNKHFGALHVLQDINLEIAQG